MVQRVFVEKRSGFDGKARSLKSELSDLLGLSGLSSLRIINRYDVEGIDQDLFQQCVNTVFSEPQVDNTFEELALGQKDHVIAVEPLPGQFDQRAESASECIQLISQKDRPTVKNAIVYVLTGELSSNDINAVKNYLINPVECREASLALPQTLAMEYVAPEKVEILEGFCQLKPEELGELIASRGLAMDEADIMFCQEYFRTSEKRDLTITELKLIDTYWSDHCRHTTFGTELVNPEINDPAAKAAFERYLDLRRKLGREHKPMCLMDLGTIGARYLKSTGALKNLDESEEINACTVKVKVDVRGEEQDWLYLFKNETHNHPTEIEPFGGAATCLGGAIRDPLSGRAYVYQAMRVTGAANPLAAYEDTIRGKLPQRKIVRTAADGYSSYGNQIGLATGQVSEIYHPGYAAKRMEVGAVIGATPAHHVRRETPAAGDVVVLLGGGTGRDGIGGATGSSKAHSVSSIETCGAEVQKGNAPVERKIQRLFRNGEACRMIKRCNDFGAGGVSVAVGELADSLAINLDAVPRKYEGLDGSELALSESQERMAVVLGAEDVAKFIQLAEAENLQATPIAEVTQDNRVTMTWQGDVIVDLSRDFLNSNGAPKQASVVIEAPAARNTPSFVAQSLASADYHKDSAGDAASQALALVDALDAQAMGVGFLDDAQSLESKLRALASSLNFASQKGMGEHFDSTIGTNTVLMPFGGERQLTPPRAMVSKLPVLGGQTTTVSGFSWGFNPYISSADPFSGAYIAVLDSVAKLLASGFSRANTFLTFQEYFEKLGVNPKRWGKPMAALLGALSAQIDFSVGAIGGKDSMSGSFEDLDVPPTLISFATALGSIERVISPEFKGAGHSILWLRPKAFSAKAIAGTFDGLESLMSTGEVLACQSGSAAGLAYDLFLMAVGNAVGAYVESVPERALFEPNFATFILEVDNPNAAAWAQEVLSEGGLSEYAEVVQLGTTATDYALTINGEVVKLDLIQDAWEAGLEPVFPYRSIDGSAASAGEAVAEAVPAISFNASEPTIYNGIAVAKPKVIIPVFPGTNCEYDTASAFEAAGAEATIFIVNNLSAARVSESTKELARLIKESQILMIPGGFSGGDEPDGSAKFITAAFRAPEVTEAVRDLLFNRDGLALGICNGFQALIKLGLVPYGDIVDATPESPTLTFNTLGRHISRMVNTRVASNMSPWLSGCTVGETHTVAISHGEGRFVAPQGLLKELSAKGQIATQYVDSHGATSVGLDVNPNGSAWGIEGITSPDGRVFGKMGHSERAGSGLYKNIPNVSNQPIFENGVRYFL